MEQFARSGLKKIVKFAKREFQEKKPESLRVLRIKDEQVFTLGGSIPIMVFKKIHNPYYLVLLDYKDQIRVYYFTKNGVLIKGENFQKTLDKMKKIKKATKIEYKLPKL